MNNVIIVAGGTGQRMESELPKQFIVIGDKPILMHTIEAFYNFDKSIRIIVVLASGYQDYWFQLCNEYTFNIVHEVVEGGHTRFHSVKNGLDLLTDGIVAIHDAARPFVSVDLIRSCFRVAANKKAAIPVTEAIDSIREMIDDKSSKIVNREAYRFVQTPQTFETSLLKKSYEVDFDYSFTDDASVVEAMGYTVHLVKGERSNIKITTPIDLELAKVIINK